jgi:hypothetical protein
MEAQCIHWTYAEAKKPGAGMMEVRRMGRMRLAIVVVALSIAAFSAVSVEAGRTVIYGPYASDSPDSGTCGNTWATDFMDRVYKVDTVPNDDGTYTVREEFKHGTFTTIAGPSPGACQGHPNNGNTVPDGLTGKMHGSFVLTVTGGVYDPNATCAAPCYTADFVTSIFGAGASSTVIDSGWQFHYNAGQNGTWKNAADDVGGNRGDITG